MKNFIKEYRIEFALLIAAFVLRIIFLLISLHTFGNDIQATVHGEDGYFEISRNLIEGNGFSSYITPPFTPNPLRTPLYLYFLAGLLWLTHSYFATIIVQIFISSLIPILAYWVVSKIIKNKTIGLWTGILVAIEPNFILHAFTFSTETLFIFLFLISILFLIEFFEKEKLYQALFAGAALGLAALVKPTVQYIPVILFLIILWHFGKKKLNFGLKSAVLFCIAFLIIISPWLYRNYTVYGKLGMSAQPVHNLYIYVIPSAIALETGKSFGDALTEFAYAEHFQGKEITLANQTWFRGRALELIKQHPYGMLKIIPYSLITFFTHDGLLTFLDKIGIRQANIIKTPILSLLGNPQKLFQAIGAYIASPYIVILLGRIVWIFVTLFAILGSILFIKKEKKSNTMAIIAIILILYFALTTMINGLGVNARFRMPIVPFILMFALYFIFFIMPVLKKLKMSYIKHR
jgi:4-amino-4-deoxy-L-arabinose transferase-like glycosyltransferase